MGSTHFRSDVREKGARTASFSTINAGAVVANTVSGTVTGDITGNVTGNLTAGAAGDAGYVKLGTMYIISGKLASFDNAGLNALATIAVGATPSDIPAGTLFLNASINMSGSECMFTKVGVLGSWAVTGRTASDLLID
jgi:hypothetical protein